MKLLPITKVDALQDATCWQNRSMTRGDERAVYLSGGLQRYSGPLHFSSISLKIKVNISEKSQDSEEV